MEGIRLEERAVVRRLWQEHGMRADGGSKTVSGRKWGEGDRRGNGKEAESTGGHGSSWTEG